jgi:tetratricopeptide (TPR) repeat protein
VPTVSIPDRPFTERQYSRPATEFSDVERDILRETASTLGVRFTGPEWDAMTRPVAAEIRPYDTYLRARAVALAAESPEPLAPTATDGIRTTQSLDSQARELDPTIAQARARVALMQALAGYTYDRTLARREQVRAKALAALRLQPDLSEAHEALASYWALAGDVPKAIDELGLAVRTLPHSANLHFRLGTMLVRAGRLEDASVEYELAMHLEPGNPQVAFFAATLSSRLRRPAQAMRAFNRALAVAPDFHIVKVVKGQVYLRWTGVPDTLEAAMRTVPSGWDPDGEATYARFTALWVERRYSDALLMLNQSRSALSHDGYLYYPTVLMRAQIQEALGDPRAARVSYTEALAFLQDSLAAHPRDPRVRVAFALALAGLGEKARAILEAHRATDLVAAQSDVMEKSSVMGVAIEALARAGAVGDALDLLKLLLSMHAGREASVPYLLAWPGFDALASDPRFEELLVRFATDSAR